MTESHSKYTPFKPIAMPKRKWPSNILTKAPQWCSVDMRDGNQALIHPMDIPKKLDYFKMLVDIGVKEIEVGFPSASETEFNTIRTLIEDGYIPDDVTIQVIVQAREDLIKRTFESLRGAKKAILNFYNSVSTLQRKVVFNTDVEGVKRIATDAAKTILDLSYPLISSGTDLRFEYTAESFSGAETDSAIEICQAVLETMGATPENKIILNLPSTVEISMPNHYADQIEYFIDNLPSRESAIVSIHTHNDRGTGVAATELALLAGAERAECTLFGNGERTGNTDILTLAMNMYSQGIDHGLDFSNIDRIRETYEKCTGLDVPARHPYAGELAFTAFSGSHQDAINKGMRYMQQHGSTSWEVPYLPIDPADIGRKYDQIIRVNSQSGKAGPAYIMNHYYGFDIPKPIQKDFARIVQAQGDTSGNELSHEEIYSLFKDEYINLEYPYRMIKHSFAESTDTTGHSHVSFSGTLAHKNTIFEVSGEGNGPIDAFFNAIKGQKMAAHQFIDYKEHSISDGSDSMAVAYIHLRSNDGVDEFGVGISHNINVAPLRGIISAINRSKR